MSQQPAGPPPPYPGYSNVGEAAYPPPNPAYPSPYDSSKGPSQGNAFPSAMPHPQYYHWPSGYSNPNQPGGGYSAPQQYGAPMQGQSGHMHATTVVVAQPAVTMVQSFRDSPVHTHCPHCRAEVVTGLHYETGTFAWVLCCVLWLVGCGLGCCLIPFCVDGCKDVIHTCPNCQQQIARYSRM